MNSDGIILDIPASVEPYYEMMVDDLQSLDFIVKSLVSQILAQIPAKEDRKSKFRGLFNFLRRFRGKSVSF